MPTCTPQSTTTPFLGLCKPADNETNWGPSFRTNMDAIDTGVQNASAGIIRSYLAGLTLSTAGGSGTFAVAAGQATDSGNASLISLAASISKTTAAWVVGSGAGGLDTGAIANGTWYAVWLIKRPDTGIVDVLFSLSGTAPTMPAAYTFKRRIGWIKTDGAAHWLGFFQRGNEFLLTTTQADINTTNPGTAAVVTNGGAFPPWPVRAIMNANVTSTALAPLLYLSSPDQGNEVPTAAAGMNPGYTASTTAAMVQGGGRYEILTDNSGGRYRYRLSASDGNTIINVIALGWIDYRGRDD